MIHETEVERARRLLNEKYSGAKVDFKESSGWTRWKELTKAQRFYAGGLIAFISIIVVVAFVAWVT